MTMHTANAPQVIYPIHFMDAPTGQCDCNCDCACSTPSQFPEAGLQDGPLFLKENIYYKNISPGWVMAYGPNCRPALLNTPALELLHSYPDSHRDGLNVGLPQLQQKTIRELSYLGYLKTSNPVFQPHRVTAHTLTAWLQVTNRCNLRCPYCYSANQPQDMPFQVGEKIIASLIRCAQSGSYQKVKIKFGGGEPLLRFDWMLSLADFASQTLARSNLEMEAIVLSNGLLLTQRMLDGFMQRGLRLMISLDDLELGRVGAQGRLGSKIINAIDLALANGLIPDISVTVTGQNTQNLPALVAWLCDRRLPFNLNFFRAHAASPKEFGLELTSASDTESILAALEVAVRIWPERSLIDGMLDRINFTNPHEYPCDAGRNYLVFDPGGNISTCQMDQEDALTHCQTADPLLVIQEHAADKHNPSVKDKSGCEACEWRTACAGGCPALARFSFGSATAGTPYCEFYKTIFPQIIELEGQRLLNLSTQVDAVI